MTTAQILTTTQVTRMFGVTPMTIWNWRQGNGVTTPLVPMAQKVNKGAAPNPRARVLYTVPKVLQFAKKNNLIVAVQPDQLTETKAVAVEQKRGPKPRSTTAPSKRSNVAGKVTKPKKQGV